MRRVKVEDWKFIHECYKDWPMSDDGPVTEQKAVDWARKWASRNDIKCRIFEYGKPVGLILWREKGSLLVVDNIVVHPFSRGQGYARRMWREFFEDRVASGITEAQFDALPGAIAAKIEEGTFQKVGEKVGNKTGLPMVTGRVTPDMKV